MANALKRPVGDLPLCRLRLHSHQSARTRRQLPRPSTFKPLKKLAIGLLVASIAITSAPVMRPSLEKKIPLERLLMKAFQGFHCQAKMNEKRSRRLNRVDRRLKLVAAYNFMKDLKSDA